MTPKGAGTAIAGETGTMSDVSGSGVAVRSKGDFNAGIALIAAALLAQAIGAAAQYSGIYIPLPFGLSVSVQSPDGLVAGSYFLPIALFGLVALFVPIRNQQDFYGGVGLVALTLLAFMASRKLPGTQGFSFGPGTAPRLFAGLLGIAGLAVTAIGLFTDGPKLQRYAIRGPVIVTAAVIFFALALRPLGLVITAYVTVVLTAAASKEFRLVETLIWAAVLTLFCALLFRYGLNLPLQLWPQGYW
jgi:putative tricarboxylic transport membrane protein